MSKKGREGCCGPKAVMQEESYHVEAIVSVDERGQMVLPKEIRQAFDVQPGDKLAIVLMRREGKVCCLQILKASSFSDQVKGMVGSASSS